MLEQLNWDEIDAGLKMCITFAAETAYANESHDDEAIPAFICAQAALYASPLCGIDPPTDELMKLPEKIRTRIEEIIIAVLTDIEQAYTQEEEKIQQAQSQTPPIGIPDDVAASITMFQMVRDIGKQLMDLHLNYEQAEEYPLIWHWNPQCEKSWRVDKMILSKDKTSLRVNESLTLYGIPARCFEYQLGNRSALEWIVDQYQVTVDQRSGIVSDPNRADDPEYIARLVAKVVSVSMETVRLQAMLATIPPECFVSPEMMPSFFEVPPRTAGQEGPFMHPSGTPTLWDI